MDLRDFPAMLDEMAAAFRQRYASCLPVDVRAMQWPRAMPLMRFSARQYAVPGCGNLFCMSTRAAGGWVRLATFVCTPNAGTGVPVLLADVMAAGKKRAAYVEYYDCTSGGAKVPLLEQAAARWAGLPEYPERPAWYIEKRAPYSLIKGGNDESALARMLADSVSAYAEECARHTERSEENRAGLRAFADRMVRDGNPSSLALERTLGREGAEAFFRGMVMPADYRQAE